MQNDLDVLVIGCGAIGICSAYFLAKQGFQVSLVEKGEIASGCSGASAGLIVPSYCIPLAAPGVLTQGLKWVFRPESPFYIKPRVDPDLFSWLWQFRKGCNSKQMLQGVRVLRDLNYASLELFNDLIMEESLSCDFRRDGWLLVYRTEQGFRKAQKEVQLLKAHDVELKGLSVDEMLEMEPELCPGISGGIFFPEDSHLDPLKFALDLAERLKEQRTPIHEQTEVLRFETSDNKVMRVITTCGDFQPRQVVLAAGVWSSKLMRELGLRLPMQPAKGYSISVKRPRACPRIPLYLTESKVAVVPFEATLCFAGMLELSGMDTKINLRRVNAIMQAGEDYLGQAGDLNIVETRQGLRPCSPDGLPIIDRFPGIDNLIIATGHGMLGITLAPVTGKLVSQLACGQSPDLDLTPLCIARFR